MKFSSSTIAAALFLATTANGQVIFDFNTSNGGFTSQFISGPAGPALFVWGIYPGYLQPPVQSNYWWYPGSQGPTVNVLYSPPLTVAANGQVTGSFVHRFAFDTSFDGGQIQYSLNGGTFNTVPQNLITGQTYNFTLQSGTGNAIGGQRAFSGTSLHYYAGPAYETTNFTLGTGSPPYMVGGVATNFTASDTVVFRFLASNDSFANGASPNWDIGSLTLNNITPVPEPTSLFLAGGGFAGLAWRRWRRRTTDRRSPRALRSPLAQGPRSDAQQVGHFGSGVNGAEKGTS